jgi:hypothetical protein
MSGYKEESEQRCSNSITRPLSLSLNNLLTSEWENTQRRREVNGIKDVILPGRHLGGSITHAPPADKEKREQQCGAAKINTE